MHFFRRAIPIALLFGAAVLPATASRASTLIVPQQYPTIQSAVTAAHAGDTVVVFPNKPTVSPDGSYHESVVINTSNLTLIGLGAVLDGAGVIAPPGSFPTGFIVKLHTDNDTIQGFLVKNYNNGMEVGGSNAHIRANVLTQNLAFGIFVDDGATGLNFEYNTVTATGSANAQTGLYYGTGMSDFATGVNIQHNTFSGNGYVGLGFVAQTVNGLGCQVSHNTVTNNGVIGIDINNSTGLTVDHNTVTGSSFAGIFLENLSSSCTISHNDIDSNLYDGFATDGSGITGCTIEHNEADSNGHDGYDVMLGDTGNVFSHDEGEENTNFDAEDANPPGANTWTHNHFGTSNPPNLGRN